MERMTDKEIIQALECCKRDFSMRNCLDCPYNKEKSAKCMSFMIKDALDLINRQQAEIEIQKANNPRNEYQACIRVDNFLVCASSLGEWLEFCDKQKADAIKEFAERLKETYRNIPTLWGTVAVKHIDNLVKEMVGD